MDNASKALVMVGAILIAVMLISLGVFLFTYARDQAEGQTQVMDATVVAAFNEQFLSYCGNDIRGTSVKSLITKVQASNAQNPDFPVETTGIISASAVDSDKTYTVTESYDTDGHIKQLAIKVNSASK